MTDEGRQTTPEGHINDQQQVWPYLPVPCVLRTNYGQTEKGAMERAGTAKGLGAEVSAMHSPVEGKSRR